MKLLPPWMLPIHWKFNSLVNYYSIVCIFHQTMPIFLVGEIDVIIYENSTKNVHFHHLPRYFSICHSILVNLPENGHTTSHHHREAKMQGWHGPVFFSLLGHQLWAIAVRRKEPWWERSAMVGCQWWFFMGIRGNTNGDGDFWWDFNGDCLMGFQWWFKRIEWDLIGFQLLGFNGNFWDLVVI